MNAQPLPAAVDGAVAIPFYQPVGDECAVFEAAFRNRLPLLVKGPTGCGKTRFVAHMAARLGRPLTTVSCHDDLTASDLTGRWLIKGGETIWQDGPLTRAARNGGVCYLDEVVEARKDVTVVLHPLTDDRRILPLERTGETIVAPDDFMLVVSYNPGYQNILKSLKPSTRQRFMAIEFGYPPAAIEADVLVAETGVARPVAERLVALAGAIRKLKGRDLEEGASTRLLVYAATLIASGMKIEDAVRAALIEPLSDDAEVKRALGDLFVAVFG
ncbi:MAG: CbbQ/NirQ/NorQ/GpvN family protein [Rhizobiales bacterium]|nr:CbbQ/NirQ/NorQ/GpvN family protein [Hyphomicrobiales bacterium]